jgi:hypothetical protein
VETVPASSRSVAQTAPETVAPEPAPRRPVPRIAAPARDVPPVPALRLAGPPRPAPIREPAPAAPAAAGGTESVVAGYVPLEETAPAVGETVLPDTPFFEAWEDAPLAEVPGTPAREGGDAPPATPGGVEGTRAVEETRAVALGPDPDASAERIRRLLDVYEGLGRRR